MLAAATSTSRKIGFSRKLNDSGERYKRPEGPTICDDTARILMQSQSRTWPAVAMHVTFWGVN